MSHCLSLDPVTWMKYMRAENKLSRNYLVLIKENKIEVRLSFKGKAKMLYHCFQCLTSLNLFFSLTNIFLLCIFICGLFYTVIIPWVLLCKLMPSKKFTCWDIT